MTEFNELVEYLKIKHPCVVTGPDADGFYDICCNRESDVLYIRWRPGGCFRLAFGKNKVAEVYAEASFLLRRLNYEFPRG